MSSDKKEWARPDGMVHIQPGAPMEITPIIELRDWFAGMALQGIVSSHAVCEAMRDTANRNNKLVSEVIAEQAYTQADAMIAEREKTPAMVAGSPED